MPTRLVTATACAALLALGFFAGCGGDEKASPAGTTGATTGQAESAGSPSSNGGGPPGSGQDRGNGGGSRDADSPVSKGGSVPKAGPGSPTYGAPSLRYPGLYAIELGKSDADRVGRRFGAAGPWTLTLTTNAHNFSGPRGTFRGSIDASRGRMVFRGPELQQGLSKVAEAQLKRTQPGLAGPCGDRPGRYSWKLAGGRLTFKPIKDPCAARKVLLSQEWARRQ